MIDGELYGFYTNTDRMGRFHRLAIRMKFQNRLRIMFFDDAVTRCLVPMERDVSVWIHVDDWEMFRQVYELLKQLDR